MDGNDLKYQVIWWLRESGEIKATALLEHRDLAVTLMNELYSVNSAEIISILDVANSTQVCDPM